jgi:hypothetical protein
MISKYDLVHMVKICFFTTYAVFHEYLFICYFVFICFSVIFFILILLFLIVIDAVFAKTTIYAMGVSMEPQNMLIKLGYLYLTEDAVLQFPSPIHEVAYFVQRHRGVKADITFTDFEPFLFEVVRWMSPEALRNSHARDHNGYLLERQWQMEFYK